MGDRVRLSNSERLPSGYRVHRTIDLKREKEFARAVQGVFVLTALLAVAALLVFDLPLASGWSPVVTVAVTLPALLLYMSLHEATHGVAVRLLTKTRPTYEVRFPFLTTASRAYLTRRSFIIVALAPCIIWGIVLGVALIMLPADWRLTVYILMALNFAGSGGDFVLTAVVGREQSDVLVQDDGVKVSIYAPGNRAVPLRPIADPLP